MELNASRVCYQDNSCVHGKRERDFEYGTILR